MPVIHVWYVVDKGAPGPTERTARRWPAGPSCVGHGARRRLGLEPKRGDLIVEKMRMNAFQDTNLETLLKGSESRASSSPALDELLDRARRGTPTPDFRAIVVTDATSTMNDEWQHALDYALTNIAERVPTADVVAALKAKALPKKKTTPARSGAKPRRAAAKK